MSETEPETVWIDVVATCRTEDCPSNGRAVPMTVPEDVGGFQCGACGQPITDVVPAS